MNNYSWNDLYVDVAFGGGSKVAMTLWTTVFSLQANMTIANLSFHHLGLAVNQQQPAMAFVSALRYIRSEKPFSIQVRTIF
jgi:hypothetical protein